MIIKTLMNKPTQFKQQKFYEIPFLYNFDWVFLVISLLSAILDLELELRNEKNIVEENYYT